MSDSPQYEAFREFARATISLEVIKATQPLQEEIRSLRAQLETRSAVLPVAGPPGPAGKDGRDGKDGIDGAGGRDGANGKDGERGADGLAGRDGAASTVPGPQGERGERGADGMQGRDGAAGIQGRDGTNGRDGAAGVAGERGEDGVATREEIESVVESRFTEVQGRTLADYHQRTYERGTRYKRGALVAWAGATHLAMADTDAEPLSSTDWQMIAKAGRDGRDGRK